MENIKNRVISMLKERDYEVYESTGCFNIAAKKDKLLFIKILKNIDSFLREHAIALKSISSGLKGFPFLIGENTNYEKLKYGLIYERFEIPALSPETFEMVLDNYIPELIRDKGGTYVEIDPQKLRTARRIKNLTQKQLAKILGVSQKTIYLHEKCTKRASIDLVKKMEDILEMNVRKCATVFREFSQSCNPRDEFERFVKFKFRELGFDTRVVRKSPIDVVASEKEVILSEIETNRRRLEYRMKRFRSFIKFLEFDGAIITEKFKVKVNVPVIRRDELEEIESKKDLIKLIKDYSLY